MKNALTRLCRHRPLHLSGLPALSSPSPSPYALRDGNRETIFHFNPSIQISNTAPDGGLFSYPAQFVPFLQLFLDNNGKVLSTNAVTSMLTPQPHGWGLGWQLQNGKFLHEGSSGTVAWADPTPE